MIKRILIGVGIFVIIGLIILWLIQGGASAVARTASGLGSPLSFIFGGGNPFGSLQLPWQPEMTRGPDISQFADQADQLLAGDTGDIYQSDRTTQILSYGTPSPYVGSIRLARGAPEESDSSQEFLKLDASYALAAPVVVSGWSVQSALTGARVYLPEGATPFIMGVINTVGAVSLASGDSAIITSGVSPVGVSFKENLCSGYLNELRNFTPELSSDCPAPRDALPETPDTLRNYGGACFDYVASLPHCRFPGTNLPGNLSSACRSFVVNTYSYNGCVNVYRAKSDFELPTWRIYLNHTAELWSNSHDIIRLLDGESRTVDVLTY